MRRTYKSKKETGSALERRDLLINLDERSSAFDAYFIQNIKQTKRELSCVSSSNVHGVASNRVRKKKYVKRIVKEIETPVAETCRDSLSRSAYLTPDKSIRVNKPLDPFDMLLNSSPAGLVVGKSDKVQSVSSKLDLFDQLVPKREGKTYIRKRPIKAKKFNYSTSDDSSDSDKENSNEILSVTRNTSNIKAHELIIEPETKASPQHINDSINNIVNNLSFINKLKPRNSFNQSLRSTKFSRHRLTQNMPSPILQNSPLCSTPFKMKYRGESIFKFSPIGNDSLNNISKTEDKDNSNNSIIYLGNDNVDSPKTQDISGHDGSKNVTQVITQTENVLDKEKTKIEKVSTLFRDDGSHAHTSSIEISSFQTTEPEPFLGFTNIGDNEDGIKFTNYLQLDISADKNDITKVEVERNMSHCSIMIENNEESNPSIALNSDKDSLYDTCTSEQNSDEEKSLIREPLVKITRLNDSLFMKYYEKMNNFESGGDDNKSIENANSKILNDEDDNKASDEELISLSNDQITTERRCVSKVPVVQMERLNNSSIMRYYKNNSESDSEGDHTSLEDNFNNLESDYKSVEDDNSCDNDSEKSLEVANNSLQEELQNNLAQNDYYEVISSNDDDIDSNSTSEEKCVSFVTTRRRNVSNHSFISMYNDSYASSSTDCDKTVLSNNRKTDIHTENKETLEASGDETVIKTYTNTNLNTDSENEETHKCDNNEPEASRISFVSPRFSNITDRKSSLRSRRSTLKTKRSPQERNTPIRESIKPLERITPIRDSIKPIDCSIISCVNKPAIVLQPGKKWERSLSIYRRMTMMTDHFDRTVLEDEHTETKGRKYRQSVISTMEMQDYSSLHNESISSRRSTFVSKPSRSTIKFVKDSNSSRLSISNSYEYDDLKGFLNEECDDTIIELSKLSIADQTHEVTVLDNFHDTSNRLATARDYVLRRCNQTDAILFDECYPDSVLKNCHKIGEGVYGEVFLWRARDGRARVLKIVPIAGTLKVNGESQKDFHEIISEIVIAMELSALRAPIAAIDRHFDEGKDVEALDLHAIENATDIFNEVLAVRCVFGSYPSRLLDLWDLYDECKGSENDNPAILPVDQQYIVLELANAGQDLESYQFNNAEQAHALFLQVAYGLAVAEEAFQFEHRDLHWGNVLIAPTEQKLATFVLRGRAHRVARCGVRATIIDYSLSRVSLPLGADCAALYNDLASDDSLFDAVGDYQFQVYRLMRDKLGNDWKNFEPYTNILWLHYTVDKMITALRYKRINTKIHKHYIDKLKGIKNRILDYGSAALFVLTDNEI